MSRIAQALEAAEQDRALDAYNILTEHTRTITTALELRRDHFAEAAAEAQAAHDAGKDIDPTPAPNGLMRVGITNAGYASMAQMFREQAERTTVVLNLISKWEDE